MFSEYLFDLCDCTCLNVICVCSIPCWSNPKIFLSVLFVFGNDFCHSCFESFSQKVKIFVLKNLVFGSFVTHFISGCNLIQVAKWFEEISISSQIQAECFATGSWVTDLRNVRKVSFKGLELTIFQKNCF